MRKTRAKGAKKMRELTKNVCPRYIPQFDRSRPYAEPAYGFPGIKAVQPDSQKQARKARTGKWTERLAAKLIGAKTTERP
jgi:hypothetical protein